MFPADTVAAIATAAGRAGIGVVRVSGSKAAQIARAITGKNLSPRLATFSRFSDSAGRTLDEGIALFFPAPHSYTGEDVLELQAHGGSVVLRLILQRCIELGARAAEPGEFTKRAFLNDKIDLAQAQAVADLIEASSAAAVRGAAQSLTGEFSRRVRALHDCLVDLRVLIEATLDFPDEGPAILDLENIAHRIAETRECLLDLVQNAKQGNLLREGAQVVLLGRPNVGKSSLMNRLAEEEVAIVTDIPGTTRDALKREIVIEGVPFHFVDTAGLRESDEPIEQIGINRSWAEIRSADILLHVVEAAQTIHLADERIHESLPNAPKKILVVNKIDIFDGESEVHGSTETLRVSVSAKTGIGICELKKAILATAGWQAFNESPFIARERHLAALASAMDALDNAAEQLSHPELLAEELKIAQQALATITGEVSSDALLGEIFSRFCIGK